MLVIILLAAAGCADISSDMDFNTLDELKVAAGSLLVFPDILPFEPKHSDLSGYHYERINSWDYYIRYYYEASPQTFLNPESYEQLEEGSPTVVYIDIWAFEPKHIDGKIGTPNRLSETGEYNRLIEEAGDKIWKICDVAVPYKSSFSSELNSGPDNEKYPPYVYADLYAVFKYNEILYAIEMQVIGHINETEENMLEMSESMLETVVTGMLK